MKKILNISPTQAVVIIVLVKLLFLLSMHIQEDAFITWRVAQNLLDYGVIGYNGTEKISASTTHLYVFFSYIFNAILGKTAFMYPLLITNSILFSIGSLFLSRLILHKAKHQAYFIILIGLLPPAIKISILGMEYGLLFFLEMSLLYFAFQQEKKWAFWLFVPLILFTRIDTVIFLGIVFLVDLIKNKRFNWPLVMAGLLGIMGLLAFNQLYFHEWVNNTIVAKQLAYDQMLTLSDKLQSFNTAYGNYMGMLKVPGFFNPITLLILAFEILCFVFFMRQKQEPRNIFFIIIFSFALIKQLLFLSQRSFFDWYYWVPQLLMFSLVLVFIIEASAEKKWILPVFVVIYILPLVAYQTLHSVATGNGEWNYRRSIGLFLNTYEKDKNQSIFLEPAGYIPYFSGLKCIDDVGLVNKAVQPEIKKDRPHYVKNTLAKFKPKYYLSSHDIYKAPDSVFFKQNYRLIKEFRGDVFLKSDNKLLEKIYKIKPSGTDYNLYQIIPQTKNQSL